MVAVRLFGQPKANVDGAEAAIQSRPLELLVRLAVAFPDGVTAERLVQDIWGERATSGGALRVTVTRLRTLIGRQHVRFERGAYRLVDVDVDLHRFETEVRLARKLSGEERVDALERAIDLADEPAFEGMRDRPWLEHTVQRIEELHENAVDLWAEALAAVGRTRERLPDLMTAFERSPMREHRCAVVALALYRAGRQAEALRVVDRTRRLLRDELGVHLGPEVSELERRMLRHDPELADRRPSDVELSVEAHLRAAQALVPTQSFDDARTILDEAERLCAPGSRQLALVELARARIAATAGDTSPGPHIDRAQRIGRERRDGQLLARAALALVGSGVPDDRAAVLVALTEPLELLPPEAPERIDLLCAASVFVVFIDASDVMHRLLAEAERLASARDEPRAQVVVLIARSLVRSLDPSQFERSANDAEEAVALARSIADPDLIVASLQAALRIWYSRGDLTSVDAVVDELAQLSQQGAMAFGQVRAHLCRASNAIIRGDLDSGERHVRAAERLGTRLRTFAVDGAVRTIDVVIGLERGRWDEIRAVASAMEELRGPSSWAALVAWCGDDATADRLMAIGRQLPRDDAFDVFAALGAEVAARRHDEALGAWCGSQLAPLSGRTVMVGLGTCVLGFADHFTGLASVATGELDRATALLNRALADARSAGATLWAAHSSVELAAVLAAMGHHEAALTTLGAIDVSGTTERVRRRIDEVTATLGEPDEAMTG
jgi:DNA-binding SARP family transcriptional activator